MRLFGHSTRKLLALVAVLLFVPAGSAFGVQTYADTAGDAPGGAPDMTAVTIAHKLAGDITFQVAFANRTMLAGSDLVVVGFDSDQNLATGYREDGVDWEIYVPGETPTVGYLYRWDLEEPSGVVPVTWSNQAMTLAFNKAQIGNPTTAFSFDLMSHTGGDMTLGNTELMPHLGSPPTLSYSLATEIATIQPATTATKVKAGKVFSVKQATVKLTTDEVFTPETLTAKATVAGKVLKARPGGLSWTIPKKINGKTTVGKKLVVSMTATYKGMTKTQQLVLRVVK